LAGSRERTGCSAKHTKEEERSQSGKAGIWSGCVPGPFTLETGGETYQAGNGQSRRELFLSVEHGVVLLASAGADQTEPIGELHEL
jgi:hypothetical protein